MENNNKFRESVLKALAVIGVIAILSLGGFITISVIRNLPGVLSEITAQVVSVTQRFISAEQIVVNLEPENPGNGDSVRLSFEHTSKDNNGSYSFFYECREGIHFERITESGSEEVIFCNTPYDFINTDNTLLFKVFSSKEQTVEVPLSINFIRNNSTRISERGKGNLRVGGNNSVTAGDGGTILITDNSGNPSSNTGGRERTPGDKIEETFLFDETSGSTNGVSDPNGVIDLKATVLEIGRIDRVTNVFTATSSIPQSSRGAIRFEVENIGTKISGTWTFNVVVPTFPSFIYHSKGQQALLPGDKIEYTIGFDSIRNDSSPNTIVVNVDPISSVNESVETNNIVKAELPAY